MERRDCCAVLTSGLLVSRCFRPSKHCDDRAAAPYGDQAFGGAATRTRDSRKTRIKPLVPRASVPGPAAGRPSSPDSSARGRCWCRAQQLRIPRTPRQGRPPSPAGGRGPRTGGGGPRAAARAASAALSPGSGPFEHRDRDRAVERDHRVLSHPLEHRVQAEDLAASRCPPARAAASCAAAIWAWIRYSPAAPRLEAIGDELDALGDQVAVPAASGPARRAGRARRPASCGLRGGPRSAASAPAARRPRSRRAAPGGRCARAGSPPRRGRRARVRVRWRSGSPR